VPQQRKKPVVIDVMTATPEQVTAWIIAIERPHQ
jgi:hypothetical protein